MSARWGVVSAHVVGRLRVALSAGHGILQFVNIGPVKMTSKGVRHGMRPCALVCVLVLCLSTSVVDEADISTPGIGVSSQ